MKIRNQIFKLALVLVAIIFVSSCGNKDEVSPNDKSLLVGEWEVITYEEYGCPNSADDYVSDCANGAGGLGCAYNYEFLADGTFNFITPQGTKSAGGYGFEGTNEEILNIITTYYYVKGYYTVSATELVIDNHPTDTECGIRITLNKL